MRSMAGGIGGVLLLIASSTASGQIYPRWFLFPDEIPCPVCAIGVAPTPYYPDSSGGEAFISAVQNYLHSNEVTIEGTKEYGATTDGMTAVSTSVCETIDSSRFEGLSKTLKLFDLKSIGGMTIALAGEGSCAVPDSLKTPILVSASTPSWLAILPQDARYYYAVGMSEPAYYESSAWLEAEKHARLELAKSVRSTVRGLDRLETGSSGAEAYSSVQDEKISVTLHEAQVVRRWRDLQARLYVILIRMPR